MSRRRVNVEKKLSEIGDKMLLLMDELSRLRCPACDSPTLFPEITMRSGIRFLCDGLDENNPEGGDCGYRKYSLFVAENELPRTDVTGVEPKE